MPEGPFWGPLDPASYLFIARSADPEAELLRLAEAAGVAGYADAATALAHERRIADLRALLAKRPRPFTDLAAELFDPGIDRNEALAALVTAGARVRDSAGSAVLSARYHLFARASEGAYTCLSKAGPARLARPPGNLRHLLGCHVRVRRLQALRCRVPVRFRAAHVGRAGLRAPAAAHRTPDLAARRRTRRSWWTRTTRPWRSRAGRSTPMMACCALGAGPCPPPAPPAARHGGCGGALLWPVRRLHTKADTVSGCLCCGARGAAMVRQFETGGDAAASVITTALYQALPPADGEERRSARGRPQAAPVQRQPAGSRLLRPLSGNQLRDHPAPAADPRRPVQRHRRR